MEKPRLSLLAGISFISAATLCLQVSLTRYLSISQNYHFAFLVISLAFLGYGASGTFLTLFRRRTEKLNDRFLSLSSLLFSLAVLLSFFLSNSLPFDFFQLPWNKRQLIYILPYYCFLGLPFFFAGATISFALTRLAKAAHKLYFFDLLGAGSGSFLAVVVFLPRGERGVFVIISGLALLGCFFLSLRRRPLFLAFLLVLFAAEALLFFTSPNWLSFRISPFKALPQALKYPQATLCLTRWNSVSRLDIIRSPAVRFAPGLSLVSGQQPPVQLGLSLDGGDLNAVTKVSSLDDPGLDFLSSLPSSLPYFLLSRPRVLVLEPRGGLDVLEALAFQAPKVAVFESNPLLPYLLRNELASFCGDLYNRPDVKVVSAHPRAAMRKENDSYDLIVFGLTDVFGAAATGLHGIGENYLYTVESFVRLLDLLSPNGIISLTFYLLPPPRQEAKILATWIEALERKQLDPAPRLAAIRTWGTLSLFIKKEPFSGQEISRLKDFCRERLFDTVYHPVIKQEELNIYNQTDRPVYEELFLLLLNSSSRRALSKDYLFEVKPATDNRPFFHDYYKWKKAKATYRVLGKNLTFLFEGKFVLGLLLFQAGLAAFIFILLPLSGLKQDSPLPQRNFVLVFFYFGLLGAAFIFIEITLIQKFILFLGHPLFSVSTVIFSLLFSSGLGSLSSKKMLGKNPMKRMRACLFFCAMLTLLYLFLLPSFFERHVGLSLGLKIVFSLGLIFPLGFFMGFPFPTGIRLLEQTNSKLIPWAWSANAFSTVVHSVLAHLIALSAGYNAVLVLAAGGYLAALPFLRFAYHGNKPDP
ncbi:MAG: hypothetical protein QHH14_03290 [Clostridiales bacterium]|nr:hypothetical protein [Clostridiales bacterium]